MTRTVWRRRSASCKDVLSLPDTRRMHRIVRLARCQIFGDGKAFFRCTARQIGVSEHFLRMRGSCAKVAVDGHFHQLDQRGNASRCARDESLQSRRRRFPL